jgi:5-methylcytosine-specific restriction protein B
MSRHHPNRNAAPIFDATAYWVERCLIADGSIFADNEALWNPNYLDDLDRTFTRSLDEGDGTFFEKLKRQMTTAAPPSRKLMAEALWILMLFQSNVTAETKRTNIRLVWGWSGDDLDPQHPMLADDVLMGLGSSGAAYNTQRWRELAFLLTVVSAFKDKSPDERHKLLSDPWYFAEWLGAYPDARNRQFRHICLHLLFPDEFERISSSADKRAILAAFTGERERDLRRWEDERIDRALFDLRQRLEAERGAPTDFYSADLASLWRAAPRAWLLSWNPENWAWESLAADRAAAARGEPVVMPWRCASSKPKEGDAAYLMRTGLAPRGIVAAGTIVKAPFEGPHYDPARADAGEVARFVEVRFLSVRDPARDEFVQREVLTERFPNQEWSPQGSGIQIDPAASLALAELWTALPAVTVEPDGNEGLVSVSATRASLPRNIILYGPPGTGKTHRLQAVFMPSYEGRTDSGSVARRFEFITFHQNYSYEDFIEGIRPVVRPDGTVAYEVRPGVFKRICERAKADPRHRYAVFIDEINRGNIAKIFGELITLLEPDKRALYDASGRLLSGLEVTLPYSGEAFGVPTNLDVVGTMNTADRSIALLDAALRRRFEFEELVPVPDALTGADGNGRIPDGEGDEIDLRRLLAVINRRITHLAHRDQAIGHASLVRVRDFPALRRVLAREFVPFLQELFYDDWRRIRLVLADHAAPPEHQLIRAGAVGAAELIPGAVEDDVSEGTHYSVTPEPEITPDAVRKIYEPLE